MHPGARAKSLVSILGTGITNGATATANFDCSGYSFLSLDVILGTSNTASNNPSVLKLSESDDTVVTNFADIAEAVGDGASGFTIPTMSTSVANIVRINVDLRKRKSVLRLAVSPTTTQAIIADARLYGGVENADKNVTEAGVLAVVNL